MVPTGVFPQSRLYALLRESPRLPWGVKKRLLKGLDSVTWLIWQPPLCLLIVGCAMSPLVGEMMHAGFAVPPVWCD